MQASTDDLVLLQSQINAAADAEEEEEDEQEMEIFVSYVLLSCYLEQDLGNLADNKANECDHCYGGTV